MFNPYGITDIYIDLDYVLVNLEDTLQTLNNSFKSDITIAEIKGNKHEIFFKHLIPAVDKKVFEIAGTTDIYKALVTTPYQSYNSLLEYWRSNGIQIHILSSITANLTDKHSSISTQKLHWLQKYNLVNDIKIHLVKGSHLKQQYATPTSLLIDDYSRNCEQFRKAGGMAIQAKTGECEVVLEQFQLLGLLNHINTI